MAIIKSLSDLFKAGASFIAEQFVRGTSRISSLTGLLQRKFGNQLQADQGTIADLENRVRQAVIPAAQIQSGVEVQRAAIPTWEQEGLQPEFIHSGLARIDVTTPAGQPIATTRIPFSIHDAEILNYESILSRIHDALEAGAGEQDDFYQPDIHRIEQAIRYHEIRGQNLRESADIFGVYRTNG